ncbi:hypothetical protein SISSUDRAFT_1010532, partial [Sistotremastrum suecicum HHB10207 ss-3]
MSHSEEAVIDEIRKASRKRPKRRFIFNEWPRDPKGAVMKASPRGKETSNGIGIWGETLNDIVFIQRIPDCPYVKTISSRSKIAAFMKEIGEDTYSPDDMDEAEEEGYPMRHVPYPTLWQINKKDQRKRAPFTTPVPKLAETIEMDDLPDTLFVHDDDDRCLTHKHEKPYEPYRPDYGDDTDEGEEAEKGDDDAKEDSGESGQVGEEEQKQTEGREASSGSANVAGPSQEETLESAAEPVNEVKQSKDKGKAKETVPEPRPETIRVYSRFTFDKPDSRGRIIPDQSEKEFELKVRKYDPSSKKPFTPDENDPAFGKVAHLWLKSGNSMGFGHHSSVYRAELRIPKSVLYQPDDDIPDSDEERFGLHYQDDKGKSKPDDDEKVTVTVACKLSSTQDGHLGREARNYQTFDPSMFEHWNGYNIVSPINDPVPVGAVVPQFYGYYKPVGYGTDEKMYTDTFESPILLVEECGQEVNPADLGLDDKQECYSLLMRLHLLGFIHNSVFSRNILVQPGPIHLSPAHRSVHTPSFRLIDFGR